jgi:tRNA pseudouridine65 synthase
MKAFRVLFEDDFLIAVDKPPGFHSHPPQDKNIRISRDWNGLGILEWQFKQKLFLVNRLDRATSGILLLAKDAKTCALLKKQFTDRTIKKTYFCLVRGTWQGEGLIEEPLKRESGSMADATTRVELYTHLQSPVQDGKIFSLVMAEPLTGRFHQIRRHLAHMGLPIIGDKQHGDKKLNRAFAEKTSLQRMYLRCMKMEFLHPHSGEKLLVKTRWNRDWHALFDKVGHCLLLRA